MRLEITLGFDDTGLDADGVSDLLDNIVKLVSTGGNPEAQLSTDELIQIAERYSGTELIVIGDEEIK